MTTNQKGNSNAGPQYPKGPVPQAEKQLEQSRRESTPAPRTYPSNVPNTRGSGKK